MSTWELYRIATPAPASIYEDISSDEEWPEEETVAAAEEEPAVEEGDEMDADEEEPVAIESSEDEYEEWPAEESDGEPAIMFDIETETLYILVE